MYAFTVISMAEGLGNKLGKAILQVKKKMRKKRNVCASPSYTGFSVRRYTFLKTSGFNCLWITSLYFPAAMQVSKGVKEDFCQETVVFLLQTNVPAGNAANEPI